MAKKSKVVSGDFRVEPLKGDGLRIRDRFTNEKILDIKSVKKLFGGGR